MFKSKQSKACSMDNGIHVITYKKYFFGTFPFGQNPACHQNCSIHSKKCLIVKWKPFSLVWSNFFLVKLLSLSVPSFQSVSLSLSVSLSVSLSLYLSLCLSLSLYLSLCLSLYFYVSVSLFLKYTISFPLSNKLCVKDVPTQTHSSLLLPMKVGRLG